MSSCASILRWTIAWTLLAGVVCCNPASNRTHYLPAFPPHDSAPPFPLLHTSLSTLLPILPRLAPAPSHTLLLTLATPAFKPLLFNYICFLRYKARWGAGTSPLTDDWTPPNPISSQADSFLPLLIVTSDPGLARELTEDHGLVVWLLQSTFDAKSANSSARHHDDFAALRALDLLLPPNPPDDLDQEHKMLEWGSLHYQSLMLERSLVMSILVSALADAQRSNPAGRQAKEREWAARVAAHDWENGPMISPDDGFVGVKGVLLVDNDAVWLSSPADLLAHPYRPTGTHPSVLWAPDMSPNERNSFDAFSMPCACFIYSRVHDHHAHLAARVTPQERDVTDGDYRPSDGAALVWKWTSLCHVAMVMNSLERARKVARAAAFGIAAVDDVEDEDGEDDEEDEAITAAVDVHDDVGEAEEVEEEDDDEDESESPAVPNISTLIKAVAPSFQATSLAPALHLASLSNTHLPTPSHEDWIRALASPSPNALLDLLDKAGLGLPRHSFGDDRDDELAEDLTPEEQAEAFAAREERQSRAALMRPTERQTCDKLALSLSQLCEAESEPDTTLTRVWRARQRHIQIRHEALPYDSFPPGMRFFGGGAEKGQRACVVHANYATGASKEKLLRERKLWAVVPPSETDRRWMCDAGVMRRA